MAKNEQRKNSRVLTPSKHGENSQQEILQPDDDKLPAKKVYSETFISNKWQPGVSGNPSGRPRDVVKEIGRKIAHAKSEKILTPRQRALAKDLGFDPTEITVLEHLMLKLATSANPQKSALFLERTFGKVPNINLNAQLSENLVQRFKSKLTDSELEDIAAGADVFEILLDKLPDVDGVINSNDYIDATTDDEHE